MKELTRRNGWAVLSEKGHVCINADAMPAVFTHRKDSVVFRDELTPYIGKGKTIPVEIVVRDRRG